MHFGWDEAEEKNKDEKIDNKFVLNKIIPYFILERKAFLYGFSLLIFITASDLSLPLILKHIIDRSLPSGSIKNLFLFAGIYLIVFIAYTILSYVEVIILSKMGLRIVTKIKLNLFNKIIKNDLKFFELNRPGKLVSRVESDAENVKQLFSNVILNLTKNVFVFAGILVILFLKEPKITIMVSAIVPISFLTTWFFIRFIRKFFYRSRRIYSELCGLLAEYLQAIEIIQTFNYFKNISEKLERVSQKRYDVDIKMFFWEYGYWSFFMMFEIIAICIVLSVGSYSLATGAMTIGTVIMFIEFIRRLFQPIMEFSEYINMIQRAFVSANRIFNLMETEPTIKDPKYCVHFSALNKEIEFKNVSFAYDKNKYVLNNLSFVISKGRSIAIVGASGAGKSTIINLCLRFYDPLEGEINFDGINIKNFKVSELRNKIGLVTQDLYLFPGTIMENLLSLSSNVNEKEVLRACEITGIDNFIKKREKGFNTMVAERGANLSVGEKQLLSFSRAISKNPEVLILDEATSSVDIETEVLIKKAIEKIQEGRTSIVIAHRLSTIMNADKIIVMEKGLLKECGSHSELISKENSIYKKMFELQFS